jgi:streptogramin lyase/plastocyanin
MNLRPQYLALFVVAWAVLGTLPTRAATHVIQLLDSPPYVNPLKLEASVGDTVVWRNTGPEMIHTITDEKLTLFSGDISISADWKYTFTKAGIYQYLCFRHNFMRGTVVVRDAQGSTETVPDFPYQRAFKEFVVPTLRSVPRMVIASKIDSSIWFTEGGGDFYGFEDIKAQNKLGRLDESGRIVEYATPTPGGDGSKVGVDSLVMDDEGTVWFTERLTNRVGRLDKSGQITELPLGDSKGYALGIDMDRQGRIWFAQRYGNKIGWIRKSGELKGIELPEKESEPRTVFIDSKGRAWYTARTANEIGYYDPATERITRLKIPTDLARPTGVCETADGVVWFVEMVGNKLAKVLGDQIIEYPIPTPFSAPFKIAAGPDGVLWFTEVFGNAIGRFDPATEHFTQFKIPTLDSRPGGITVDPRGRVWFTEQMGNKIGMLDPVFAMKLIETPGREPAQAPAKATVPSSLSGASIHSFELPSPGSGPGNDLVEGDGGWLWFNEIYSNRIGAFQMRSHEFKEWPLAGVGAMPVGLVRDAKGVLWSTLFQANALARIDPQSGTVEQFPLPHDAALPAGIALDPHGEIWLTQLAANRIAHFDRASQTFDEYELPRPDSSPLMISSDGRGALWISATEENGNYVARFDLAARTFEAFDLPAPDSSPTGILPAGDVVWVAEGGAGKLARLDLATRKWEELKIPAETSEPVKLAMDSRGRIWITDGGGMGGVGGNRLAVYDPSQRRFDLIPMQSAGAKPRGILAASDGNIWFTQQNANLISLIQLTEPHDGKY